jgi:hypothetical protein
MLDKIFTKLNKLVEPTLIKILYQLDTTHTIGTSFVCWNMVHMYREKINYMFLNQADNLMNKTGCISV